MSLDPIRPILALAAVVALALPAQAHVTLDTREAAAGTTVRLALRVPHGCGAEATLTLRVLVPAGLVNAQPMVKPGWELAVTEGDHAEPVEHRGAPVAAGVQEIAWSGGALPSAYYDEFVLRGTLASGLAPDTVLHFPVVQECATGEALWIDTSGAAGSAGPAPALRVTAPQGGHGH